MYVCAHTKQTYFSPPLFNELTIHACTGAEGSSVHVACFCGLLGDLLLHFIRFIPSLWVPLGWQLSIFDICQN